MSDDIDAQTLAASVYLDNEATPDERALVETDPDTLAEVTALGAVRTVLGATTPQASISEREAHLAGALDVFERMSDLERAGEVTPSSGVDAAAAAALSTPLSSSDTGRHRRPERRSSTRWLTAAAAVLVLLGVGAVARGVITSGDDVTDFAETQADATGEAASEVEVVEQLEADEVLSAESDFTAPEAAIDDTEVFAEEVRGNDASPPQSDTAQSDTADSDTAESSDDSADTGLFDDRAGDEAAPTVPADAEVPAPAPDVELTELANTDDLAAFATLAVTSVNSDGDIVIDEDIDFDFPPNSCEEQFSVQKRAGFANYDSRAVQVGVDVVNRIVYAYIEVSCELVAQTSLPDDLRGPIVPASTQP